MTVTGKNVAGNNKNVLKKNTVLIMKTIKTKVFAIKRKTKIKEVEDVVYVIYLTVLVDAIKVFGSRQKATLHR